MSVPLGVQPECEQTTRSTRRSESLSMPTSLRVTCSRANPKGSIAVAASVSTMSAISTARR